MRVSEIKIDRQVISQKEGRVPLCMSTRQASWCFCSLSESGNLVDEGCREAVQVEEATLTGMWTLPIVSHSEFSILECFTACQFPTTHLGES